MKTLFFTFLLSGAGLLSQAQNSTPANLVDSVGYAHKLIGKVVLIGDTWLIESMEQGSLQRYVPAEADKTWHSEGMEIVFSGVIGRPDPHVRSMGNPIVLKEWRQLYRASPDGSNN